MKFPSKLAFASLIAAAAMTTDARASWELVSGTAVIHHNTGDALTEGLPASKTVNLAGDTVVTLATCSGQVRKQIVGTGSTTIVTTQTYDAKGNLLSRRDATNAGTNFVYDELGRKTTETDAQIAGKVRTYTYDAANRLITETDPLGVTTSYAYDLRDRRISESTPMNGTETRLIQYGYNGRGHMTTLTDANGAVTNWGYDSDGSQVSKTYANGDHRTMEYDAAGRVVTLTDENGHDITSVYDLAGRLTSKHFAADNTSDTFLYDTASRMTSVTKGRYNHTLTYTYDNVGRVATETHPDGTVVTQTYDAANRLANLSLAGTAGVSPAYSVDYAFDNRGLLSTVTSGDYATSYTYRTNGQLASTIDSRLSTPQGDILRADRFYDAGARLTQVANTAANGDQAGVTYTLTVDDQRVEAVEESGQKWNYGYDGLKQLVTAKKTDTSATVVSPLDQSYSYDPMGNRRTYADQSGSTAYTANNANQYTAVGGIASVYDKNGNLLSDGVKNYVWDAENQLIAVTPVNPAEGSQRVEYTYDWRMRRTAKKSYTYTSRTWSLTKNTGFKYHEWNPIEETVTDVATSAVATKNYVWGNDLSGNLHGAGGVGGLLSMKYEGGTYFYGYDGNGNVRALVKADGANSAASVIAARYAYDGFGKEVAVSGVDADKNTFRFSTKQLDAETGMNYYGYRFYIAENGRWLNRDLIEEAGGVNVYAQCRNGMINSFDMLGMWKTDVHNLIVDAWLPSNPYANYKWHCESFNVIEIIKRASAEVDGDGAGQGVGEFLHAQSTSESYKHAMSEPFEFASTARSRYDSWVREMKKRAIEFSDYARNYATQRDMGYNNEDMKMAFESAIYHLGVAFHAVSDNQSPSHTGFQTWYGPGYGVLMGPSYGMYLWNHARKEDVDAYNGGDVDRGSVVNSVKVDLSQTLDAILKP